MPKRPRVGILALLQESNTFLSGRTTRRHFEEDLLLRGEAIRQQMAASQHEVAGFFAGLAQADIEAVPLFVARAYPHGVIEAASFDFLLESLLRELEAAGPLDGILAAPHGATVAEQAPDADGHWLRRVREKIGPDLPLIATLDPHANLSPEMVAATTALIAYNTNPHLDQRQTGEKAAALMARVLRENLRLTQAAAFPPMAINIQRQRTDLPPLSHLYTAATALCARPGVISHSLLLGFPYADVAEMGSAALVVTEDNIALAQQCAQQIAREMWQMRR